jgi:exopolysaccharide biosynthesis protein
VVVRAERTYNNGLTIDQARNRAIALGHDVVGGINANFFNSDMTTVGMQIQSGVLISYNKASTAPAIGFHTDGQVVSGNPNYSISVSAAGSSVEVDQLNYLRGAGRIHMYTSAFSETTRTTQQGVHVVMRVSGGLVPGVPVTGTVTQVLKGTAAHTISHDEFVLSATSQAETDRLAFLTAGMEVTVSAQSADERWHNVRTAIAGLRYLVRDGQPAGTWETARSPRTAAGLRADGSVVLYAVDGRRRDYSNGLSLGEVASRMIDMGCVTVIELDGGGSTAMTVRMPGETESKVVSRPSDGSQRRCANYLMLVNTAPRSDGHPALLFPQPGNITMMPNASLRLSGMLATDDVYRAASVQSGWETSVEAHPENPEIVSAHGNSVTSHAAGVTAVNYSLGGASGTAKVEVVSRVDSIAVSSADTGRAITSLSVNPGDRVRLTAAGILNNTAIASSVRSFTWGVEGDIGEISADGLFTAVNEMGITGRILISGGGQTAAVQVALDGSPPVVTISGPNEAYGGGAGMVSYTVTAIDGRGLLPDEVSVTLNGEELAVEWNGSTAGIILQKPEDGLYILSVKAMDSLGRRVQKVLADYYGRRDDNTLIWDAAGKWYTMYVDFLDDRGILDTEEIFGHRYYRPEGNATRLEVVRMMHRALELPPSAAALPFDDIGGLSGEDLEAVRAVYAAGLISGKLKADGALSLDPGGLITRAELFTILNKTVPSGYEKDSLADFSDKADVPSWALSATQTLVGMGVVSGADGKLNPGNPIRRAEVCSLLSRLVY